MKFAGRKFVGLIGAGLLLWLAGCATKIPPKQNNPYFGYVYCKTIANDKGVDYAAVLLQIKEYEKTIVDNEFYKRRDSQPKMQSRKISDWNNYVANLRSPVVISLDQFDDALRILKKKEQARVESYFRANKQGLEINGREVSSSWKDELSRAEDALDRFKKEQKETQEKIDGFRKSKDFFSALDTLPNLRSYGGIGSLENDLREEATQYWLGLIKDDIKDARAKNLENSEVSLRRIYPTILRYKEKSGNPARFFEVEDEMIQELGTNWQRQIAELGFDGNYWSANQFAINRVKVAKEEFGGHAEKLVKLLGEGYNKILPGAIEHYVGLASEKYSEDLYGVSYVYCSMANLMFDFCKWAGFKAGADAVVWSKRTALLMQDVEEGIHGMLSRRLVVYDFNSDERNLALRIRTACKQHYGAAKNGLAWALDVPDEEHLSEETLTPSPMDQDYVVSGEVADYSIEESVIRGRKRIKRVATSAIKKIRNPNYKEKGLEFSDSRYVYEQRVDLYPETLVKREKKITLDMNVSCSQGSHAAVSLFSANKVFSDSELKIRISVEAPEYGNPYAVEQNLDAVRANLERKIEDAPTDGGSKLPSDSKIYKEVDGIVVEGVVAGLNPLVVQYPIELLDGASPNEDSEETCNRLGVFMMYCDKLSEGNLSENPLSSAGYIWYHRKNQIEHNLERWSKDRWVSALEGKDNIHREITEVWDRCRDLAIQLDAKK